MDAAKNMQQQQVTTEHQLASFMSQVAVHEEEKPTLMTGSCKYNDDSASW